jgi:CheY-like chemotaxis protein
VTDSGQGIAADLLPHVFDRFRQADSAGRPRPGLGLGLAVVRELVQAHGGTVAADSPGEGLGSTFRVTLPLAGRARPSSEPEPPREFQPSLAGIDVLVVDDNEDARDLLVFVLESRGAAARAVGSAVQALQAIEEHRPDVLLADLRMPEEDGYWLIRTLRGRESGQGRIRAIAVTADASPGDRESSLAAGYDRHLAKPVDPTQLVLAVAQVVGGNHA